MQQLYFLIREETDQEVIENCGRYSIFISTDKNEFSPGDENDDLEELLGCEKMEGIYGVDFVYYFGNEIEITSKTQLSKLLMEQNLIEVQTLKGIEL